MRISSISENKNFEKRISITPEIAKKYISLGFQVCLLKNYAVHLGIKDELYKNLGVEIINNNKELIALSDILIQVGLPEELNINEIKENKTLIGILNPYINNEKLKKLLEKKN